MLENPIQRKTLVRSLIVLGTIAFATAGLAAIQLNDDADDGFHANAYPGSPPAPDFELVDHNSVVQRLSDFQSRPLLLFFGFTECPDVCPLTLSVLSRIIGSESGPATETQILLVTVDPENDTPEKLNEYVSRFGPSVTGFTGTESELAEVRAAYGVYSEKTHTMAAEQSITHTPVVFGIDRAGRLRVLIHGDQAEELIREDIRTLANLSD